jgi:hypothetical protein
MMLAKSASILAVAALAVALASIAPHVSASTCTPATIDKGCHTWYGTISPTSA